MVESLWKFVTGLLIFSVLNCGLFIKSINQQYIKTFSSKFSGPQFLCDKFHTSKARKSNQQKKDHWSFFCARKGPWSFFCYYIFIRLQVSVKYKKYMGISAVKCLLILYTYPAYFAETLLYKAPLLIQRTRGNPRTMLIQ